jgi:hypothetical protein
MEQCNLKKEIGTEVKVKCKEKRRKEACMKSIKQKQKKIESETLRK